MWVFFILEPVRLLRACKPGSRARMDSRTGGVGWVHPTYADPKRFSAKGKISQTISKTFHYAMASRTRELYEMCIILLIYAY